MEKTFTFEDFTIKKGMETNWNPKSFFIGEDIASVHTDKHELQVFAYKYNESETTEYFEMNFGKKSRLIMKILMISKSLNQTSSLPQKRI